MNLPSTRDSGILNCVSQYKEMIMDAYKGNETILAVDDDMAMRIFYDCFLGVLGYKIIFAKDGEEGVYKFKQHKDSIKVILMDVRMPKKDGVTAYHEIREIQPDANIIFVTACQEDTLSLQQTPNLNVISKPSSGDEIAHRIRMTIDGRA